MKYLALIALILAPTAQARCWTYCRPPRVVVVRPAVQVAPVPAVTYNDNYIEPAYVEPLMIENPFVK